MAIRLPYETKAGGLSEAETYAQLIEHLRLAQEGAAIIGHYRGEQGDEGNKNRWLILSETLGRTVDTVTLLATRGIRQ